MYGYSPTNPSLHQRSSLRCWAPHATYMIIQVAPHIRKNVRCIRQYINNIAFAFIPYGNSIPRFGACIILLVEQHYRILALNHGAEDEFQKRKKQKKNPNTNIKIPSSFWWCSEILKNPPYQKRRKTKTSRLTHCETCFFG